MASSECSVFVDGVLDGVTAVVTGGGSGIGFGIACALADSGASVVVVGRRGGVLDAAVAEIEARGGVGAAYPCDVRDADGVAELFATVDARSDLPPVGIVVNGAAGNFLALAEELSPNGFATVMGIDAQGVFNVSRAALPYLKAAVGSGAWASPVIVNISATLHCPATWWQSHASAAKAAIDSLTRSLALEWGAYGVRVVGVAPGPVRDTPGFAKLGGAAEGVYEAIGEVVPLGRIGTVEDIAAAVVFMASRAAAWITGTTLVVDGGAVLYSTPVLPRAAVSRHSRGVEGTSRATGLPELASKL